VLGKDHPTTLVNLNNLGSLYQSQARYSEAERLYQRVLERRERVYGKEHPDTLTSLSNLALLYYRVGRFPEAEALYRRVLETAERVLGKDHPISLVSVSNLAAFYNGQGDFTRAGPLFERAVASLESVIGKDHPTTQQSINNLAMFYIQQKRFADAEPLLNRAIAAQRRVLGEDHPQLFTSLYNLAELYRLTGREREAEASLNQLVAKLERVLGKDHPDTRRSLSSLGLVYFTRSDWTAAQAIWRRITDSVSRRSLRGAQETGQGPTGERKSEVEQERGQFLALIKTMRRLALEGRDSDPAAAATFELAQWGLTSEAGRSLAQMAARGGKSDPKLALLVRERQDLIAEWQKRDAARSSARGMRQQERNAAAEAESASRLAAIEARVAQIDKTLRTTFPDYAALANPEPLSIEAVQAQLRPDEALVMFVSTTELKPAPEETFIWVVTKTEARWVTSPLGIDTLAREVQALRCGLDYTAWEGTNCAELTDARYSEADYARGKPLPFDLARAQRLYEGLLGGIADLIGDKQLLIVPSGPLTQLPFHALVTRPSGAGDMRSAAWLARRHAITILPAVSSLKALRALGRPSAATRPLLAVGNPLLDGPDDRYGAIAKAARERQSCPVSAPQSVALRSVKRGAPASIAVGSGLANLADIRRLAPLPETADELCAVVEYTAAAAGEVRLGARATEREMKRLSETGELAKYRMVHFATHGAMAGQLHAGAEPGLVLTPPAEASEEDDGYLSASEIAALRLDADWVLLSACNTAAGRAQDAEALSGLARAFIYAQARALLVSHWEVDSAATVKLITLAMREIARGQSVGRAEALRRAMLSLIDRGEAREAHPAFWAPFIVVGEGAAH
jgi:CHAT domain-containing protein/Tfp pilus assembly protein PilF